MPIAFESHKLSDAETRYDIRDKRNACCSEGLPKISTLVDRSKSESVYVSKNENFVGEDFKKPINRVVNSSCKKWLKTNDENQGGQRATLYSYLLYFKFIRESIVHDDHSH